MTHTVNKITDEPHLIRSCYGEFVVFDGLDCRITINGEGALDAANEIKKCVNIHDELVEALKDAQRGIATLLLMTLGISPTERSINETINDAAENTISGRVRETLKKAGAL